jgi:hypothetical protein
MNTKTKKKKKLLHGCWKKNRLMMMMMTTMTYIWLDYPEKRLACLGGPLPVRRRSHQLACLKINVPTLVSTWTKAVGAHIHKR